MLPGATATDFWDKTGFSYENLPESIVMSAEDMVDAALVGLDLGERVTIPGLHNRDEWDRFEARASQSGNTPATRPAPRYRAA